MAEGTRTSKSLRRWAQCLLATAAVGLMAAPHATAAPVAPPAPPSPAAPAPGAPTPGAPAPGTPNRPAPSTPAPAPSTPNRPAPAPPTQNPSPTSVAPGDRIDILQRSLGGGRFESLQCTMGFAVTAPNGERLGVTAGHCGSAEQPVGVKKWIVGEVVQSVTPKVTEDPKRPGHFSPVDPFQPDWATFRLTDPSVKLLASSPQIAPRLAGVARPGDPVCQLGSVNGHRCGTVTKVMNDWVVTDIVTTQGDSGGPLIRTTDNAALGIITDAVTLTDSDSGAVKQRLTQYYSINAVLRAAGNAQLATR
ncbi:S1 family peptidase [Tsukamurella strandjordii]|uniref:S1 family peptidase n=1 Tax=Tsukamurella strandjordii TaxID=147577 RepID=UPI0031D19AEF